MFKIQHKNPDTIYMLKLSVISVVLFGACSKGEPNSVVCSKPNSVSLPSSNIESQIRNGSLKATWGGIIDLLESGGTPEKQQRRRCTITMDFVPSSGVETDAKKIAFWTADHCLNFAGVEGAEIFLFDPQTKKYMRLKIQIQELDLFKQGLSLFQTRASLASETDLSAEQDLNEYIFAAKRNPVQLNGADLIERGTPICKADTSQFKALNPEKSTVCSTVLDLARIEALVPEFEYQKPEISEALKRMSSDLAEVEKSKFASSEALEKSGILTSAQRSDYDFYLTNWRLKVSALTTWKRYEAQSGLIEKVRNCADGSEEGICAAGFRSYFAPAISEYLQWDPTNVSSNLDFRQALKNEVYHDIRQQYPSKHNLKWLLEVQKLNAQAFIPLHGKLEFASNFSKIAIEPEKELKVVGEMAPLFFGKLSTLLLSNGDLELKLVHSLTFNDKSMLISHSKLNQSQSANYLPQPGDSGSVLVTDSTPIGIVSTVDGVETSGGTSILPLPEFPEDSNEPLREGGDEIIKEPASAHVNTCR